MMYLIFWIFLVAQMATSMPNENCRAEMTDLDPSIFSTYTPYEYVREQSTDPVDIPQCEPMQFWMMARHGTRYTDESGINCIWDLVSLRDKVLDNHDKKRGKLCCKDLGNLKHWNPQAFTTLSMNLSPQGYKDMYDMAVRLKNRFPTLLNNTYSPDLYEVKFTNHQRTTASAIAFIQGMFGSTHNVYMPPPLRDDVILQTSHFCKRWKKDVLDNKKTYMEMEAFEKGPEIAAVLKNVSFKLGFEKELTFDDVFSMYTTCRLEKSWNLDHISPWCAAFSDHDLEVISYREDLKHYYLCGAGTAMNKDVGCPPAKDFLARFSNITNGEKQPMGVFYISHDRDLHHFLTFLGIGISEGDLTHSNFEKMRDRKWKISNLTPFAGNLAVVFFKCGEMPDEYKVQFYLHEKPLEIEGCNGTLCLWSYIREKYGHISDLCDLSFC